MEDLKDKIIRLALFYADVMLGLQKGYDEQIEKASNEQELEAVKKKYESLSYANLTEMVKRAESIAGEVYQLLDEDDLK